MVYKIDEEYPLDKKHYTSQALYIARRMKANETLVERIEAAMGKDDALRVRRLQKYIAELEAELDRQDRDSLLVRQVEKALTQIHQFQGVITSARYLLEQEPVPLDELRRLMGEFRIPRADLGVGYPSPDESPR